MVDSLLKLVLSEIVLRYAFYLYWNIHLKTKASSDKSFDWRSEFELADEFVWIQVLICEMWITIIVYPVLAILSTIILYLHSRYLIYRLLY